MANRLKVGVPFLPPGGVQGLELNVGLHTVCALVHMHCINNITLFTGLCFLYTFESVILSSIGGIVFFHLIPPVFF